MLATPHKYGRDHGTHKKDSNPPSRERTAGLFCVRLHQSVSIRFMGSGRGRGSHDTFLEKRVLAGRTRSAEVGGLIQDVDFELSIAYDMFHSERPQMRALLFYQRHTL